MNCFRFYFERIKCKEYLFNLSSCITHLWEKQKWCSLWSDKVCKLVFDAKLNSLGRLMSRVWKARLIVVKHRRFINCQTTHSKCSRLPGPILPRNLCGAAYATEKLEAWACSSVCQSVSARVGVWESVCVAASLNLHAHLVGGGRWAVGGGRGGAWRRSQPTSVLCNFRRNLHLQLKLQHKQLLLPWKQTHTHSPKV